MNHLLDNISSSIEHRATVGMQALSYHLSMYAQASCCHCRQREFLERTISTLRRKVTVEGDQHRADYVRIRQVGLWHKALPSK